MALAHKRRSDEPLEMSSKKPVAFGAPEFRQSDSKRAQFRDPRFDEFCGDLNETFFESEYSFLNEQRETEINAIRKELRKCKNIEKRKELQSLLSQYQQELTEKQRQSRLRKKLGALKAEERSKISEGKKPYFLKKSKVKEIALHEKFDQLKKSGKLQKYMEKKRKSNAAKDRRWMPYQD